MESTAIKFIERIKRLGAVPSAVNGTIYDCKLLTVVDGATYYCRSMPCKECCYPAENCHDLRFNDFPQSLEYHRKTYPEDFV